MALVCFARGEKITCHTLRISCTLLVIRTTIVLRSIISQTVHSAQLRLGIQALVQFVQPRCPNIIYVALPRTLILVEQLTAFKLADVFGLTSRTV